MTKASKKISIFLLSLIIVLSLLPVGVLAEPDAPETPVPAEEITENIEGTTAAEEPPQVLTSGELTQGKSVEEIVAGMTLDEKISQMIIPSIRSWNGTNVTNLNDVPELAEVLKKHQYGGILLFGANIADTEQTTRLLSDLQVNNAAIDASTKIPYLFPLDEEGGVVSRLTFGTRMTGSMAIGATEDHALDNARLTGRIIGEELAALGFQADFAPDIDVNNNPANPVIGTRSFSNDPYFVASLGAEFANGLAENSIIGTYKHFPGHGDTVTDSHIGTPSVDKTYEELKQTELVPFVKAIENGADMIMTAHITFPKIDEKKTFANGKEGYYPATMSHKFLTEILRNEMGFQGVVTTDALEMDAIQKAGMFEGQPYSAEYGINAAAEVINAGGDILLRPIDLTGTNVPVKIDDKTTVNMNLVEWYDTYIAGLIQKVGEGAISIDRINESVTRILNLKQEYGILDTDTSGRNLDDRIANAVNEVGSSENHDAEMDIAEQAITLLKNDDDLLPLDGGGSDIVFAGRNATENVILSYVANDLVQDGVLPEDTCIVNQVSGQIIGSQDSDTKITIGSYSKRYEPGSDIQKAVQEADVVIAISNTWSAADLKKDAPQYQGITAMTKDVHEAGGHFVLLSDNLPYDAARFQDSDAIVLAYMGSAMGTDPIEKENGNADAYNANVIASLRMIFGVFNPQGHIPVDVPKIKENEDGSVTFTDEMLYERGFGLSFENGSEESDDPVINVTVSVLPPMVKSVVTDTGITGALVKAGSLGLSEETIRELIDESGILDDLDTDSIEIPEGSDAIDLLVEFFFEMDVQELKKDAGLQTAALTLGITPRYEIKHEGESVAKGTLPVDMETELMLPVGTLFEGIEEVGTVHIIHTHNGSDHAYEGKLKNLNGDWFVKFHNPDGFSKFRISNVSMIVATIGEDGYKTLQEAVDAVPDKGTIVINPDVEYPLFAVVSREVRFTVINESGQTMTIKPGYGYEMMCEDNTYTFTKIEIDNAPSKAGDETIPSGTSGDDGDKPIAGENKIAPGVGTGDTNKLVGWVVLLAVAAASGIAVTVLLVKKNKL